MKTAKEIADAALREHSLSTEDLELWILRHMEYHVQKAEDGFDESMEDIKGERDAEYLRAEKYRKTLHKIACAECTVHDENCELGSGSSYCACDARIAGDAVKGYSCPIMRK